MDFKSATASIFFFLLGLLWCFLLLFELCIAFFLFKEFLKFDRFFSLYAGLTAYFAIAIVVAVKKWSGVRARFFNTLLHELIHLIFAYCTLSKPRELVVRVEARKTDRGDWSLGHIRHEYNASNIASDFIRRHLVSLSPYFLPLLTFVPFFGYLLVSPFENSARAVFIVQGLFFCMGFTYGYHLRIVTRTAGPFQSDFRGRYFYGMTFVLFMNVLFVLLFLLGMNSNRGSWSFLTDRVLSENLPDLMNKLIFLGLGLN